MSGNKGWIGVDLDRTLAFYDRWRGIAHIGHPIKPIQEMVKRFLAEGTNVKIITARMSEQDQEELDAFKAAWYDWSIEHLGELVECTCEKDFNMIRMYDDLAVQVEQNTGRIYDHPVTEAWKEEFKIQDQFHPKTGPISEFK